MTQEPKTNEVVFKLFGHVGKDEKNPQGCFSLLSLTEEMRPVLKAKRSLREATKLTFLINSGGGWNDEALALYGFIANLPFETTTVAVGMVESAATTVYLAGKKRLATPFARFLFHEGSTRFNGSLRNSRLVEIARAEEAKTKTYVEIIAKATGNKRQAARWLRGEFSFSAEEAKKLGIVHEITEGLFPIYATFAEQPAPNDDHH